MTGRARGTGASLPPYTRRRLMSQALGIGVAGIVPAPTEGSAAATGYTDPDSSGGPTFDQGSASSGWRSFRLRGRRVILDDLLNGKPVEVVLDSGVGRTAVDVRIARALNLQFRSPIVETGVAGDGAAFLAGPAHLVVSGISIPLHSVTVVDLAFVNAATPVSPSVILGEDLFDFTTVCLDFKSSRLLVSKPNAQPYDHGFVEAPLLLGGHHRRHMPFSISPDLQLQGMVDLGSDAPLYLSPQVVSDLGLMLGRPHSLSESIGAEGSSIDIVFTVPSLTLGGVTIKDVPARVPRQWTVSVPAVIGLPLLSRYSVSFCFPRNLIALRPDPAALAMHFEKDRSGIGAIMEDGRLRIVFVSPNSPASRVALRPGDEILTINGNVVKQVMDTATAPLGTGPKGTRIDLKLSNGRQVQLVLDEYF